jgi:hypothetical protein
VLQSVFETRHRDCTTRLKSTEGKAREDKRRRSLQHRGVLLERNTEQNRIVDRVDRVEKIRRAEIL